MGIAVWFMKKVHLENVNIARVLSYTQKTEKGLLNSKGS